MKSALLFVAGEFSTLPFCLCCMDQIDLFSGKGMYHQLAKIVLGKGADTTSSAPVDCPVFINNRPNNKRGTPIILLKTWEIELVVTSCSFYSVNDKYAGSKATEKL